jgi:hypothetical protein
MQDIDQNAPNYVPSVAAINSADLIMTHLFVLALRDRQTARAISWRGNGGLK